MPKAKTDPLMELIARKLHGISQVSDVEKGRMIRKACKAAKEFHDRKMERALLFVTAPFSKYECDRCPVYDYCDDKSEGTCEQIKLDWISEG